MWKLENSPFSGEFGKTRDELVLLGIPESEATIYLALLIIGESKAGEIATKLSMHGLDVYHDLKNLQSKDMVEGSYQNR